MTNKHFYKIKTISEFHRLRGVPNPEHPQISLVDYAQVKFTLEESPVTLIQDFYTIGLKRNVPWKFRYGQQEYDFDEGIMSFIAPGQVYTIEIPEGYEMEQPPSGWLLLIHPDFLWGTSLAKKIKQYEFTTPRLSDHFWVFLS